MDRSHAASTAHRSTARESGRAHAACPMWRASHVHRMYMKKIVLKKESNTSRNSGRTKGDPPPLGGRAYQPGGHNSIVDDSMVAMLSGSSGTASTDVGFRVPNVFSGVDIV